MHYFLMFGCLAYIKNTHPRLKKLDDRSTPMIFVGYESRSMAYHFYNPNSRCVVVLRDVVFNEEGEWKWSSTDIRDTEHQDLFIIDYTEEVVRTTPLTENGGPASPHTSSPVTAASTPSGGAHAVSCTRWLDIKHPGATFSVCLPST
jgi:hypothetical protein